MKIRQFATLRPIEPLFGQLWDMYVKTFEPINELAAQRHLMHAGEFTEFAADPRINKYVGFSDYDEVIAFGASSPHLDSVHLISPAYYRRKYGADLVDQRRLFYVLFIGADPDLAERDSYAQLLRKMSAPIAAARGVAALDMCAHNRDGRKLDTATHRILARMHPGVGFHVDDQETFVSYDFRGLP